MPFATDTLPEPVQALPKDAQAIWLSVFNSTFRTFAGSELEKEEAAFIAAWGAVRSKFAQDDGGEWSAKSIISFDDPHGLSGKFTHSMKFVMDSIDARKRIVYGEVYVPWTVDAQGDFADEGTIEDAAHNFLKHFGTIGEQHRLFGGKGAVVESFTTRDGDKTFGTKGTWVLGTQFSEEMWQKTLNGEITGYSLGGNWKRIPLVAGREFAKGKSITDASWQRILNRIGDTKAAAVEIAELDEALFERTANAGPRVISQIVDLNVEEVSGVSLPANRENFKLFKSGGANMGRKIHVIGKGVKCDCETGEETKVAGSPWVKLYEQRITEGDSPEKAREYTEMVLGPAPAGTFPEDDKAKAEGGAPLSFTEVSAKADELAGAGNGVSIASLLQAKYAAGPDGGIALPAEMSIEDAIAWAVEQGAAAGIFALKQGAAEESVTLLKQVKNAVKGIAQFLGVKHAESTEEEAMTPQEKKELDDRFDRLEKAIAAIAPAPAPAAAAAVTPEAKATTPAPIVAATTEGGDGAYAPTPDQAGKDLVELAGAVKEIAARLTDMDARISQRPGTSDVTALTQSPEAVTAGKSVTRGYKFSSILGTMVPDSANNVEAKAAADRQKRKQERRDSYRHQGAQRVR